MTALEDRLRSELRAESEEITPDSIADLRLPSPARPRRRGARRWPPWVMPLAAAAAVTIVVAGTFAIAHMVPSPPARKVKPVKNPSPPAYYAYTVQGDVYNYVSHGTSYSETVSGRYAKVRSTATGKLLATISPPKPYNDFSLITADASANTFVFGAMRHWERNENQSLRLMRRNQRTPMKFLVLHITPRGHTQLSGLSLPEKLAPGQQPSIALSPDGARLAVAFGGGPEPAYVQMITLATGQTRQWVMLHTSWTPLLSGMGAWAANGRTLLFGQMPVPASRPRPVTFPVRHVHPATTTRVWLLDTAAPGTSLAASKRLVLHAPGGEYPNAQPSITPDGTTLIMPTGTLVSWPVRARGALAVYSARTGRLRRTLAPWTWRTNVHAGGRGGQPSQLVAWSNWTGSQLIVLQPRDELNVLGSVTGHTFTPGESVLLRQQPSGYQWLQDALRAGNGAQVSW